MGGCTWSTTVFRLVVCVKWHSHECQQPGFTSRTFRRDKMINVFLALRMLVHPAASNTFLIKTMFLYYSSLLIHGLRSAHHYYKQRDSSVKYQCIFPYLTELFIGLMIMKQWGQSVQQPRTTFLSLSQLRAFVYI